MIESELRDVMETEIHLAQPFNLQVWDRKSRMGKVTGLISSRAETRTYSPYFSAQVLPLRHEH